MKISCKHFAYKTHINQLDYHVFTIFYKSFLGIRISDYFNSYSQADKAPIKLFNRI